MDVLGPPEIADLVAERGGELFVWTSRPRCCGAVTRLDAATVRPRGRDFRLVQAEPFRVWLAAPSDPQTLDLEIRGRKQRIEAYWDGCAYVV